MSYIAQLAPISLRPIGRVCNSLIIKEIIELEGKKEEKEKSLMFLGFKYVLFMMSIIQSCLSKNCCYLHASGMHIAFWIVFFPKPV